MIKPHLEEESQEIARESLVLAHTLKAEECGLWCIWTITAIQQESSLHMHELPPSSQSDGATCIQRGSLPCQSSFEMPSRHTQKCALHFLGVYHSSWRQKATITWQADKKSFKSLFQYASCVILLPSGLYSLIINGRCYILKEKERHCLRLPP